MVGVGEALMIIQRSELTLQSTRVYQRHRTTEQTVRAWVDDRPPSDSTAARTPPAVASAATFVPKAAVPGEAGAQPAGAPVQGRLATIAALIEWLTGKPVQVLDPADLGGRAGTMHPGTMHPGTGPQEGAVRATTRGTTHGTAPASAASARVTAGWGLEMTSSETTVEREATTVAATGSVTTTDGRRIDVAVDLQLSRTASRTSTARLLAGDAAVTDPLMLSFTGAAGLGTERTAFDLDADGTDEQVPDAVAGTAFLVLDRNGNGVLDDGGELFGPATGDGFAELAAFDADGNGWIDEADPGYTRLGLATSAQGPLASLTDRGVGAIGLASVASPYTFTSGDRISGILRSTGIWLGENGSAGTVQQVDIAT
jgi:hypothetical protein